MEAVVEKGEKRYKLSLLLPTGRKIFVSNHPTDNAAEQAKKVLLETMKTDEPARIDDNPEREEFEEETKSEIAELVSDLRMDDKTRMRENVREALLAGKPEGTQMMDSPMGAAVVAERLSPQLGSDAVTLTTGKVDMRRFTKISKEMSLAIAYLKYRGKKVGFWNFVIDNLENYFVAVDGLARRQMIEMQRATTPGGGMPGPEPEEPGWLGRNVTNRDWNKE